MNAPQAQQTEKKSKLKKQTRTIRNDRDKETLIRFIEKQSAYPFTATLQSAKVSRSIAQNRLQFQWFNDVSSQCSMTPEECRCFFKLQIGVPLLRETDEYFNNQYLRIIHLDYEAKIALMGEPFNFPVTSLMSVEQFSEYLRRIERFSAEQGWQLTDPGSLGLENAIIDQRGYAVNQGA